MGLGLVLQVVNILKSWLYNAYRPPYTRNVLLMFGDDVCCMLVSANPAVC